MRSVFLAIATVGLIAGAAYGQYGTAGSAADQAGKAAAGAAQSGVNAAGKAVEKGANAAAAAFTTEGQAKNKIEASGYTNITGLSKDSYGVWHGKAQKDGMLVNISLDTQGNVKTE
ncbi:MAG TPA: hypothetical protein VEU06_11210 [Micropepsaceae bacterium]|nr:hypothetical protein [Micropepsaceae bacterium]